MTEAPRASKAEFEAFFGFLENNFDLVKSTINSVSYRPGAWTLVEKNHGLSTETMKLTVINSIASDSKLSPNLREAILRFFTEPAVIINGNNKISMKTDDDRLDAYLHSSPCNTQVSVVVAINKLTFASSFWDLPPTETEIAEDADEFRFKISLFKVLLPAPPDREGDPKYRPHFDWEFKMQGTIDVRYVDVPKFTQLEAKFDKNFNKSTIFTPSAITALAKPRQAIYDFTEKVDLEDYKPIVIAKDREVRDILSKVVHSNILFRSYSSEEQLAIVDAFEQFDVSEDDVVIRQGEPGAFFYVVSSGELEILLDADGLEVPIGRLLGRGDYFGELALMYNTPRAASVKAKAPCVLWRIDRITYRRIVTHYHNEAIIENTTLLSAVVLHGKRLGEILDRADMSKVVAQLDVEEYADGAIIVRQGNVGDSFYIIKSGSVAVWQQQDVGDTPTWVQIATLGKGDFFGEKAMLSEDVRLASCIASGEVRCLSIHRDDFTAMLGEWKTVLAEAEKKALLLSQQTEEEKAHEIANDKNTFFEEHGHRGPRDSERAGPGSLRAGEAGAAQGDG